MREKILSLKKYLYFMLFLVIGISFFFFPMFQSKFDLMPGNGYNAKLFNYVLEHSWLWLQQIPNHKYFWDAPFAYPSANTLAFSDTLMGVMPLYWIFRTILSPFGAMQFLLITLSILNYSTFYYLLRKQTNFSDLAASMGSFVFAFSIIRSYRMDDINLFTQFFSILAIIFLLKVNKNNTRIQNHIYFILFAFSILMQFYTCFILGFFLVFTIFWTMLFGFLPKTSRDAILNFFKHHGKMFSFYCGVIIALLAPLSYHFTSININGFVYVKPINELLSQIPDKISWLRNVSMLDSIFFTKAQYFGEITCDELWMSLGIFTMILSIFGLFKLKYSKGLPIIVLSFIFLASCGFSAYHIWKILYYITLGSEGMQSISRIAFSVLIIMSFGVSSLIQYFQNTTIKNKTITTILLVFSILLITAEQIPFRKDINTAWKNYSWSKKEFKKEINTISKGMLEDCEVFRLRYNGSNYEKYSQRDFDIKRIKLNYTQNLTAMWVEIISGKKTYNGYSTMFDVNESEAQNPKACIYSDFYDFEKIK